MFKKAERKSAKLRAALCGTSGSGKTYSALLLARGLAGENGKIAVIDTERGSASLYADVTDFDVAELAPPYSPARYRALIADAAQEYDVLVIDSLSHAWSAEGGVLDMHDQATMSNKGGNSYTAWRDVTPQHNQLVDAILSCPCHVITTLRSKTAYELQDNGNGKKTPVKIGLAPIQRDGMEYEFTLVLDVSVSNHIASSSKDRTQLWDGRNDRITVAHGEELRRWLESGKPLPTVESLLADLAACQTVDECRLWLPAARQALRLKPGDVLYAGLTAEAKARADQIKAAQPEPPIAPLPRPPVIPNGDTSAIELDETELEAIE